jgi:hypothetical protein
MLVHEIDVLWVPKPPGKLLSYMVCRHSIDPNPGKVSGVNKMKLPKSLHDVQKLMGHMAALSKFISLLGIRGLPFFKLLKKQVTQEAQEAFEDLKKYLTTPTHSGSLGTPRKLVAVHIGYKQCG